MADRIITFKRNREVNIGIVIALVILVYLSFNVYFYFTKSEIALHEVQPGVIYSTEQKDGMILRTEELITTEIAGYINYYFSEGSRISKNSTVYSIDSNRNMYDLLSGNSSEMKLSGKNLQELKHLLQSTLVNVSAKDVVKAKSEITTSYQRMIDETLMDQLMNIVAETGITSNFHVVNSSKSGIISYVKDKYAGYTIADVSAACFTDAYQAGSLYSMELISANSPVYKLITDDEWSIVVMLDDALYGELLGKKTATFYINNELKVSAPISCFRKGDAYFAELKMDRYISNYASERFVKIKFELEQLEGLKIPESAITLKDYYRIPEAYIVLGGNGVSKGLLVEEFNPDTGVAQYTFREADIFYTANGFAYIDCNDFAKEVYISTPDMSARVMLYTFVTKLEGAYNINKGYAVFKRIERLKTENNYVIIKNNSISGLSAYDHIALDAATVLEDAVIY